jgi:vacuolar protein sorting-associated protein VTA1
MQSRSGHIKSDVKADSLFCVCVASNRPIYLIMPLLIPSELKKITAFVRRAEELDLDPTSLESRLVAYYCRQYAVQMSIPLASSSAAAKKCLGELMAELEREKPVMDNFSRAEAALLCRKFANEVFDNADVEDRMGNATKGTARTFYAASSFLQILEQFSETDGDDIEFALDEKKILYSKWKSTEILKAVTEGRTPTPGGYVSVVADEDDQTGREIKVQRGSSPLIMPLLIPSELKKITAFVRRAEELDLDQTSLESRLVAYYCRQYAVQMSIPLASSSAAAKKCLGELMAELEREKPVTDNFSRAEAALLCRKFANEVFDNADVEDRMGNATKGTARTFYAAASFLQILEQFSEADGDVEFAEDKKKILYSKWKSTEILKAVTEGRTPTPGGYVSVVADEDRQAGGEIEAQRGSAPVETVSGNSSDADDHHREHQQPTAVDPPDLPDIPQAPFMYPISDLRGSTESTVETSSDSEIEEASSVHVDNCGCN